MGSIVIATGDNSLQGIKYAMRMVLKEADKIWARHGQPLVVTSAANGAHSAGSYHYYGLALDLRTNFFGKGQAEVIAKELREALPAYYDVVLHSTHMHVEFDLEKFRNEQYDPTELLILLS